MRYVLVILEAPIGLDLHAGTTALATFATAIEKVGVTSPAAQRLNAGAYLLPIDKGLPALAAIHAEAEAHLLGVRTLFLDKEPMFILSRAEDTIRNPSLPRALN